MALNNGMNLSPIQLRRVDAKAIGSDTQTIDQLFQREPEKMEAIISGAVNNRAISQGLANPLDFIFILFCDFNFRLYIFSSNF